MLLEFVSFKKVLVFNMNLLILFLFVYLNDLLYLSNGTFSGLSVPCSSFYDNSIQYTEVQRIGGLQSHLLRIYQDIVLQEISKKASSESDPLGIVVFKKFNHIIWFYFGYTLYFIYMYTWLQSQLVIHLYISFKYFKLQNEAYYSVIS